MAKIFISYRREDSQYQTDKLYERLSEHVQDPRRDIFLDVDNIPFGLDFVDYLDSKVSECEVLLAVIGKDWINATDPATGARRIEDPKDFVRIEIASALKRGIPVVPVLLDDAPVPSADQLPDDLKPLARRNGITVARRSFNNDVATLVNGLPIELKPQVVEPEPETRPEPQPRPAASPPQKTGGKAGLVIAGLFGVALMAGGGAVYMLDPLGWRDQATGPTPVTAETATVQPETPGDTSGGLAALSDDLLEEAAADVDPVDDSATLAARAEAVRGLQSALRDLGLYTSVIDGDAGPGTRSAVTRFTSDFGGSAPDLEAASVSEIEALTGRVEREVVALAGRENAAWAVAQQADTVSAYRAYLVNHPTGANVAAANARIRALERGAAAAAWSRARSANTVSAYETYLRDYPGGANASDARARIASLTTPTFRTGQSFRDTLSGGGQGPEMVVVPSGSFTMGSPESEAGRGSDEGPQRTVRIGYSFAVGKTEVTWAEWEACVADGGCNGAGPEGAGGDNGWGRGNRPVIEVSWNDAQAYVQWLSRKTGERYRLLSEAEWEYVARAGTTGRFSNDGGDAQLCRIANGADTSTDYSWRNTSCSDGYGKQTAPVGSFAANPFGLHDLHGNVWEWTQDCYVDSYSGALTDGSARIVSDCSLRVLRGGSWRDFPRFLRSAIRGGNDPSYRYGLGGFRVARTL